MRLAYCFTNEKDSRFLIQGPLSLAYRIFYLQLYYFCHEFFLSWLSVICVSGLIILRPQIAARTRSGVRIPIPLP